MGTRGISKARKSIVLLSALLAAHTGIFVAQGAGVSQGIGGRQANGEYHIYTREDLVAFGNASRGATLNGVSRVVLKSDIKFNEVTASPTTKPSWPNKWEPINLVGIHFAGDGHTISGLFVDKSTAMSGDSYGGLFKGVYGNSVISDLGIVDSYIEGGTYAGAIAGSLSESSGGNTQIRNCFVRGTVVKAGGVVGGLVGFCGGTTGGQIWRSYSAAAVTGLNSSAKVGGLVGTVSATATVGDCFWQGSGVYGTQQGVGDGVLLRCEKKEAADMSELEWRLNKLKLVTEYVWGVNMGYPFLKDANKILRSEIQDYAEALIPDSVLYIASSPIVFPQSVVVGTDDTGPLDGGYEVSYLHNTEEGNAEFRIIPQEAASAYLEQGTVIIPFTIVDLPDDKVLRTDVVIPYDGKPQAVLDFAKKALCLSKEGFGEISLTVVSGRDSVSGFGNYTDAVKVSGMGWSKTIPLQYTVGKAQLTKSDFVPVWPSSVPIVFDGAPHGIGVSLKSGLSGVGNFELKYNGEAEEPVAVGEYIVSVDCQEGTNYAANTVVLGNLEIIKAELSSSFKEYLQYNFPPNGKHPFNGQPYAVEVSFKPSVAEGFENVQPEVYYNGSSVAPSAMGEYTITTFIPETKNHSAATIELGAFSIVKGIPDASLLQGFFPAGGGKIVYFYDGTPRGAFSLRSDLPEGLGEMTPKFVDKVSGDTLFVVPTHVGQYKVLADFAEGENYRATCVEGGEFEISKAFASAEMFDIPNSVVVPYDGEPHPIEDKIRLKDGYEGVGNVVIKYYYPDAIRTTAPSEYGSYDVLVSVEDGYNYEGAILKYVKLDIIDAEKETLKKWLYYDLGSREYTGGEQKVPVEWAEGVDISKLGVISQVLYDGVPAVPVNVGTYKVSVHLAAAVGGAHGVMEIELGDLIIRKASMETRDQYDRFLMCKTTVAYDGTPKEFEVKLKEGLVGLGEITVEYEGHLIPNSIGNYAVKVTIAEGSNFLATEFDTTFTITKMAGILVISQADITYTGIQVGLPTIVKTNLEVNLSEKIRFEYKSFASDDYAFTDERPVDAGTYVVRAISQADGDYAAAEARDTFMIKQAQGILEISQDDVEMLPDVPSWAEAIDPQVIYTTNMGATIVFQYKGVDEPDENYSSTKPNKTGHYIISAIVQPTKNYTLATKEITFSIRNTTGITDVVGTAGQIRFSSGHLVPGATVYLEADLNETLLQGAEVAVYDLTGKMIERKRVEGRTTLLHTPTKSGIYLYTFINSGKGFRRTIKAVVR
ncbi:MAG: MBG domain-containing protein [Tannerellaceae bacterium]|jgi:hypothetical protein|nr:MBG domain-containing protein [Tannerellaceae bacterium]